MGYLVGFGHESYGKDRSSGGTNRTGKAARKVGWVEMRCSFQPTIVYHARVNWWVEGTSVMVKTETQAKVHESSPLPTLVY